MNKPKKDFSVIVNVNLEYIVRAKDEKDAQEIVENIELPNEYVEDSFEIVKIGKIGKDGYSVYDD